MDHRIKWRTPWSVSRVLAHRYGSAFFVPSAALERGRLIHAACEAYDLGQGPASLTAELQGYYEAWKLFTRECSPSWAEDGVEAAFDNEIAGYHGIIDRVGSVKGHHQVVADIKTGAKRTADKVQLCAYSLGRFPTTWQESQRMGIYIRPDGTYTVHIYEDIEDYLTWRNILEEVQHGTGDDTRHPAGPSRAGDGSRPVGRADANQGRDVLP